MADRSPRTQPVRRAGAGFAYLGRGLAHVAARPRLLALGLLPPLLTTVLLVAALVGLSWAAPTLVRLATPFLDPLKAAPGSWQLILVDAARWLLAMTLVLAGAFLAVTMFAALTLALGAPAYDAISKSVDAAQGPVAAAADERDRGPAALRNVAASLGLSALWSLLLFLVGLIPAVGSIVGAALGAIGGGYVAALELLQPACERRGIGSMAARRRLIRGHRSAVLGFGLPVYLCLLVPLLGLAVFPGAVAGATLLARDLAGEPVSAGPGTAPAATS